ncbi:MAG TPA: DUF4388 domain-containing protein [Candidatus Polarisedimenticolia bacterium]|jgi:hypothetical protein
MALEGTLRDFSLADIFQLIGIQKKTGVLTLKYAGEEVTVSFLNGCVVSADSLNKNLEDRLGTVLVKSGRVSQAQLSAALKTQKETLLRLGYILVKDRLITEGDLKEALRLQITQIVYRLFRWKDGEYHFNQEETVEYDREHFTPLSAENILMEGIRMIDEWPIIERKIPSFDIVLRKTRPEVQPVIVDREDDLTEDLDVTLSGHGRTQAPASTEGLRLPKDAAVIYEQIDGRRSVQEIIDRVRMGDFETCRILYDMLSRNLILGVDRTESLGAEPARRRAGPILERLGYAALAAAVLFSLLTMSDSPMPGSPRLMVPAGSIDMIHDLITRNRIDRLDEAVEIYYLQKGFYPDDLKDLVKGRLVCETTLHDPWGRSLGFISTTEGYRIIAYDAGGVENPTRSISRGRVQPAPAETREPPADAARLVPSVPDPPRR